MKLQTQFALTQHTQQQPNTTMSITIAHVMQQVF